MRALQLTGYDGPDALAPAEVDAPVAGDGEVLVDVKAIGINFPDLLLVSGQYQYRPDLPVVPGCELAGEIASAPQSSEWSPGDRVAAFVWDGAYAQQATAPLNALMRLPEKADFRTGAGMVVNYHTTHFALDRRGRLQPGETLLVLGAAGGIGTAAVQVGKALGATVIGGVADEGQLQTAIDHGADDALVLAEGFSRAVRERTDGRGVDAVLDPLGDWVFGEALRALAPEGRILIIGFAAGAIPEIKVNRLLLRNASAVGVAWGAFLDVDPQIMSRAAASLETMFADGFVAPQLSARCAFDEIPDALQRLGRGEIRGKLVADPPG